MKTKKTKKRRAATLVIENPWEQYEIEYELFSVRTREALNQMMGRKNWTLRDIAAEVHVCPATVWRVLTGAGKNMYITTLHKFASVCQVTPNFLMGMGTGTLPMEKQVIRSLLA